MEYEKLNDWFKMMQRFNEEMIESKERQEINTILIDNEIETIN